MNDMKSSAVHSKPLLKQLFIVKMLYWQVAHVCLSLNVSISLLKTAKKNFYLVKN